MIYWHGRSDEVVLWYHRSFARVARQRTIQFYCNAAPSMIVVTLYSIIQSIIDDTTEQLDDDDGGEGVDCEVVKQITECDLGNNTCIVDLTVEASE